MATSGNFYIESGSKNVGYFTWNLKSQSRIGNSSTINFKLTAYYNSNWYSSYKIGKVWVVGFVDGKQITLYEQDISATSPIMSASSGNKVIAESTFVYPHEVDGTKSDATFFVQYETLPTDENPTKYSAFKFGTITLPSLTRAARVTNTSEIVDGEVFAAFYTIATGITLDSLEAGILTEDGEIAVPFRTADMNSAGYGFQLTEEEWDSLRNAVNGEKVSRIRVAIRMTKGTEQSIHYITATYTITGGEPEIVDIVVKDINSATVALTGDEKTLVKGESMAEYSFTPVPKKGASIVQLTVQNGSKLITGMSQGVIDDVENGFWAFRAIDNRGSEALEIYETECVEYLRPTCYQKLTSEITGETGIKVELTVSGNFFNGSFGAVDNTLKIEVRHTQNDGTMGEWVDLSPLGYEYDGNTYELKTEITGLDDYTKPYTFQCRATDKLHYVQSAQYVLQIIPVFDWDNKDFNFNVPINMNGETVLRHNKDANNTVLSASGGHIYLRPGGTNDTGEETILYPDGTVDFSNSITVDGDIAAEDAQFSGSIEVSGDVDIVGELTVNGAPIDPLPLKMKDYVIDYGSESMGSNGTWYWEKWYSGKHVCWGRRNYGRMSLNTLSNGVYVNVNSITQTFPSGVFQEEVSSVQATMGCEGTTVGTSVSLVASPAEITFNVESKASITLDTSYISFYAVGR